MAAARQRGSAITAKTSDIPVGGGKIFVNKDLNQHAVITQPTEGEFKAFTSICTHAQCDVADVTTTINCTACHGSKFSITDGSVVNQPAPSPLAGEDDQGRRRHHHRHLALGRERLAACRFPTYTWETRTVPRKFPGYSARKVGTGAASGVDGVDRTAPYEPAASDVITRAASAERPLPRSPFGRILDVTGASGMRVEHDLISTRTPWAKAGVACLELVGARGGI